MDSQSALGKGITKLATGETAPARGSSLVENVGTIGHHAYGDTTVTNKPCKFLWIENPWGGSSEMIDGIRGVQSVLKCNYNIDTFASDLNGEDWHEITGVVGGSNSGYVSKILATNVGGFLPKAIGGSSTTYWCDKSYTPASLENVVYSVGGGNNNDADAGMFRWYGVFSGTSTKFNGRLCKYLTQSDINAIE